MNFLKLLEGLRIPFWDNFFLAITGLGGETLSLVAVLCILWCFNKKTGYYLVFTIAIGLGLNRIVNALCMVERPWMIDRTFSAVDGALEEATGYSFPSGHTQSAVSLYGGIAVCTKGVLAKIFAIAIIVLVGFSRMYLGVHTPKDVFAAIIIGIIVNFAVYYLYKKAEQKKSARIILSIITIIVSGAFLLTTLVSNGANQTLDFETAKMGYSIFGGTLGLVAGWFLDLKYINYETKGTLTVQLFKCVVGVMIILGVKSILKAPLNLLFGGHLFSHAARYFITALAGGVFWPATFKFWNKILVKNHGATTV